MKYGLKSLVLAVSLTLGTMSVPAQAQSVEVAGVIDTYVEIALAGYRDSLQAARDLKTSVETMLGEPTEENLLAAQRAWQTARIAYQQTEVFRFGNPLVDQWVDRVNAWPMDEGFLDYVDDAYTSQASDNPHYTADLIGTGQINVDGEMLNIERFTPELIRDVLEGAGNVPANVASGFHAIEFLLWGQDSEKAEDRMGLRPVTDFDTTGNCTHGNCDRRAEFLFATIDLLIGDLEEMVSNWEVTGPARRAVSDDPDIGLATMLHGMAQLSAEEIAGNYLQSALDSHDPEAEMDAFSDYSHISYLLSARGVVNLFLGEYFSIDADIITGPSLADLIKQKNPELDAEMRIAISTAMVRMRMLIRRARDVETFDQMIAEGNTEGNAAVLSVIDALKAQAEALNRVSDAFGIDPA